MRRELVPHLRCPVKRQPLTLDAINEREMEVREGWLITPDQRSRYPIREGVAELLPLAELDQETHAERQARDEKRRDWTVERQRPYLNDAPQTPWIWPAFAANVEQGLSQIDLRDKFVLDIGCATAWSTRMICERGAHAVALDISTGMLRDAEAQFATGVYFDRIAGTMTQLPFEDALFDVVFTSAAVHHASDLKQTLREFSRVLKPNGVAILVNEPVCGMLRNASAFGMEDKEAGMNEHIYRLRDYQNAAHAVGFHVEVLFPADLEKQLNGENPLPPSLPLRGLRSVWKGIRAFKSLLLPAGHWMIGLSLVMVARKG